MLFFADEMLGKLARWLRLYGLDVSYHRNISDEELIKKAIEEGRVILTRDTRLIKKLNKEQYFFIKENYPNEQVKEFYQKHPKLFKSNSPLSRCAECNTPLQPVGKERVKDKVWPYVYKNQSNFTECPSCGRVYWEATHVTAIRKRLAGMLGMNTSLDGSKEIVE